LGGRETTFQSDGDERGGREGGRREERRLLLLSILTTQSAYVNGPCAAAECRLLTGFAVLIAEGMSVVLRLGFGCGMRYIQIYDAHRGYRYCV